MKKNHRWRFLAALLAAGMVLTIGGCSGKKNDRVSQIRESGAFRVAIVNTDSRYTGFRGETPVGIEPELCDMIAQALGVTTEYQVMSRSQALQAVNEGQADIAVGCINATGRLDDEYQISTPYGKGFFYAVTKAGDYAMTVGALEDSLVGVDSGMDEETRAQLYQAKGISVQDYENLQDAAADIKDGTIRAYICYEAQAKELALDSELQVQNLMNLDAEEFVIVAGKESQTLISGIDIIVRQFLEKEN
ncbi:transporter substrate-binding domain-containing protein [Enterocloster citroniae]|uniref:ABC-type amino acid transport substrate-binding protein n=2 Tax=Enterocloster citroniae TaxID=358743 RepID=A0ABV2G641_9FIRM|nr:transporter substrate-binding domain-containing protein [Enterocloster citroniae]KMW09491.1 hypothetical protein HMPREF9470_05639 [[Clostridium] citroniae WAL-19142]